MVNPVVPSSGALTPLGLDAVRLASGFWGDRVALNGEVIIAHCQEWMEKEGWIGNFRGDLPRRGREFSDSEIYKLLEGMAWAGHPALPELASAVAGAQKEDGYLNTRWNDDRYSDLEWGHELYCYGHLIQAGVARLRTHGEDEFTEVVRRAADHVCDRFMHSTQTCGHPVVEMALVELYRATGTERYLEMARRFVERRGTPALDDIPFGRAYFQDDMPVRRAEVFRGHVVRAVYLASGAVDVAVETGDDELLAAIEAQWERTVARRTHLTGGMGSHFIDEAFGEDFELPPDRAYSETCAGIGSIMLAHRLLLATGRVRYADLAERTMYNVLATSPASDGRSFFYANPLRVRVPAPPPEGVNLRADGGLRSPWFTVSCCPNNIARTLASLPAYLATTDQGGVQIHHYASGEIRHGGLLLRVETDYPRSGAVTVRVAEGGGPARLSLRIPNWAHGSTLGQVSPGGVDERVVEPGYAVVERDWRPGDEIRLGLPMAPRWTRPDPRMDALRGCAAVERGPVVYCAESPGDEADLDGIEVGPAAPVEHDAGGTVEVEVEAVRGRPPGGAWPYTTGTRPAAEPGEETRLRLVPYHGWGNRGPATMRVWLPVRD
ncbi:glycoside hydrolase family 127 protein [Sphaerisporangium corydalis]|uniref:Glycoside hydrolase family 127 protein n=1 Tax=Sphaerisporangium corydalis TaxID=1441875 RepID=A0ABV9ETH8_9ACTN|nr:beta-L-arabinofuranosidase domain-containing protein [Sphaerisporangium corydalis]